jgi:mannose-6-phosphate isomerase-like protein (cupin superfamily)
MLPPAAGFTLDAGGGERLRFSDAEFLVRASADTTGGGFTIIEEIDPLDTPLHVHEREDELFYVLEGEHVFRIGDEEHRAGPDAVVFGPRGVPHAHRRVVPRTGRFLTPHLPRRLRGLLPRAGRGGPDRGRRPRRLRPRLAPLRDHLAPHLTQSGGVIMTAGSMYSASSAISPSFTR